MWAHPTQKPRILTIQLDSFHVYSLSFGLEQWSLKSTPRRIVPSHAHESAYRMWRFGILYINGVIRNFQMHCL